MDRLLIAVALAVVAVAVAAVIQKRTSRRGAPTRAGYGVPTLLDRADFDRPDAPWLVVLFSSATCNSCESAWDKARHLASADVAVQDCEATEERGLHERYGIDAVPTIVIADDQGVVRGSFLGTPTATDLWATLARLRDPGLQLPDGCDLHQN
jgi:hypothetical protein